jgi:hypothetical protein
MRASEDRIIAPDLAVEFDGGAGRAASLCSRSARVSPRRDMRHHSRFRRVPRELGFEPVRRLPARTPRRARPDTGGPAPVGLRNTPRLVCFGD